MSVPVTEQFLSAERTEELLAGKAAVDHEHEGGGTGGAGPTSYVLLTAGNCQQWPMSVRGVSGAGRRALWGNYAENLFYGPSLGVTDYINQGQLSFANAGWYQIGFRIWAGFAPDSTTIPEYCLFSWNAWDGASLEQEIPVRPGLSINRTWPGVTANLLTPVFHHPGAVEAPAADGAIQFDLQWEGDAQLESANGTISGTDPGRYAVKLEVTKLA